MIGKNLRGFHQPAIDGCGSNIDHAAPLSELDSELMSEAR